MLRVDVQSWRHGCWLIRICSGQKQLWEQYCYWHRRVSAEGCGRAEPRLPCHMRRVLSACLSSSIPHPPLPCLLACELFFYGCYHQAPLPVGFHLGLGNRRLAGDERMGRKKEIYSPASIPLTLGHSFTIASFIFLWPQPSCGPSPMVNDCFPIPLPDYWWYRPPPVTAGCFSSPGWLP